MSTSGLSWLLPAILALAAAEGTWSGGFIRASAATGNGGKFVEQSVPSQLTPGQTATVSITMLNTGSTTWTREEGYKFGTQNPQDNTLWTGNTRVQLSDAQVAPPGKTAEFVFDITAPSTPGSYAFQWRMVQEEVEWFGEYTPNITIRVADLPKTNCAKFISQSVPQTLEPGQSASASITMRNCGTTTWTANDGYKLGTQNPQDNILWTGASRVKLAESDLIKPGSDKTFTFAITAPSAPGTYAFQYRMMQENVEWFGQFTPNLAITVAPIPKVNAAQFVSQSVPALLAPGEKATVSITLRNTGTTTWTRAEEYRLGSQNPENNGLWTGNGRIELAESVAPGSSATFTFVITAPAESGVYNFQWRMLKERVEWFGDLTPNVSITVRNPAEPTPTPTNALPSTPTPTREPPECRPRDDCPPRLDAAIVSDTIPTEMVVGQSYDVSVTVKNTGRNTWTRDDGYKLGARDDEDPFYPEGRVLLPPGVEVQQDETFTFQFTMTAPRQTGIQLTDWQMLRENVQWFGQVLSKYVRVEPPPTPHCPPRQDCETPVPGPTPFPIRPGLWPASDEESSSDDIDGDGIPQSLELQLAQHFFPTIWYDPGEDCPMPGGNIYHPPSQPGRLVFRVRPHPQDPESIAITYALLYARDCGDVEGVTSHHGDVEPFAITLRPNAACPLGYGIVAMRSWAHEGTEGENVDNRYLSLAQCDFGFSVDPTGHSDVVLSAENKHGNYLYLSSCDSGGFMGSDHCGFDFTAGDLNAWVGFNAGEWGARRHRDLAPLGFNGEQMWSGLAFCGGLSRESNCPPPVETKLADKFVARLSGPRPVPTDVATPEPTPNPINNARFVSQSVPPALEPGESAEVTITLQNSGENTWDPAADYFLGSQAPENNRTWGLNRVSLAGTVEAGQETTFTFTIRAPDAGGAYPFQWQMLQENVEWFGETTPIVTIQVGSAPEDESRMVGHTIPSFMTAGKSYPVSVTVLNAGSTTWSAGDDDASGGPQGYSLVAQAGLLIPPGTKFPLPPGIEVQAGQSHTFEFTIDAPFMRSARTELRMEHEGVGSFGETLALRVEIDQPQIVPSRIALTPASGPPGALVTVDLLEGPEFSPREKIRFSFGDPAGHGYSLVPVSFSWASPSRMTFTVPANAACGSHYVAVKAGSRVASQVAEFQVTGGCDASRQRSFDVLTYNIKMLPDEACPPYTPLTDGCNKDYRAGLIISHPDIQGHDAIVFVEAFSDTHRDRILQGLRGEYPYQGRILGKDHGLVQDGGVVILSKWPIESEDQEIFSQCRGFADCHADKGVNYAAIDKAGVLYHVFGTHLDSGEEFEDVSVRLAQLAQMSGFVAKKRIPRTEAVLLAGDFNVDRNGSDREYKRMLFVLQATQPERVGTATNPSGQWIDYVLFANYRLSPSQSRNEVLYPRDAGGGDLSDHYAVLGSFQFADSQSSIIRGPIRLTGLALPAESWGGNGTQLLRWRIK